MALLRFRGRPSANRFMALSSDDEEQRVPSTVPASSAAKRRIRIADLPESSFRPHGVPLDAKACEAHVRCPDGSTG